MIDSSPTDTGYRPLGVLGAGVTLLGAVLVVVAYTALDWLEPTSLSVDFAELNHATDAAGSTWLAGAYFSWLGWVLLAAATVLALAANAAVRSGPTLPAAGGVLAAAGAVVTVFALKVSSDSSLSSYVSDAGTGYWFAVVGFVLIGVGAGLGLTRPGGHPPEAAR